MAASATRVDGFTYDADGASSYEDVAALATSALFTDVVEEVTPGVYVVGVQAPLESSTQTIANYKQATKFTLAAQDVIDAIVVEYE